VSIDVHDSPPTVDESDDLDRLTPHLVADALGRRRGARARLLQHARHLDRAGGGPLDRLLDDLAARAARAARASRAAGDVSPDRLAATLLLEVVHRLDLARPAITRLLDDPMAVDDAIQTTLLAVERRISTFQSRSRFRTWLFAVARNEALMALRRHPPVPIDPWDDAIDRGEDGTRFTTIVVSRHLVDELLLRLPAPYGETMLLRVAEQLDYDQIATRLGVPIGTVRSRLAKARDLLRLAR